MAVCNACAFDRYINAFLVQNDTSYHMPDAFGMLFIFIFDPCYLFATKKSQEFNSNGRFFRIFGRNLFDPIQIHGMH